MELRTHNTGLPLDEDIEHFIVDGDETCLLTSDGNVYVICFKDKKKHDVKADSRVSITVYCSGSVGGVNLNLIE